MAGTDSVALRLARAVLATQREKIADDVMHATERVLLDSLACGLGAVGRDAHRATLGWARRISGNPAATIIGEREMGSVLGAGLVNCTAIRDLDMNDTYYPMDSGHPSDNIGAVLAVAEAEGSSAEEALRAILICFEVEMRGMEIAKKSFQRVAGWDHTTLITIATAAASGVLLKLDESTLAHAINIAACYPTTGELRVGQISMMKSVSAGLAATRGVEAAYLAKEGVTGPAFSFEGRRGISALMFGECNWDVLTESIKEWRLPRTNLKRFPAAYIIHSSIDAALTVRNENGIDPRQIKEVRVDAFSWLVEDMVEGMGGISRYNIDGRETADHSLPYCVAVALLDGDYTLEQLDNKRWEAPDVRELMARTKCFRDKEMDARFPKDRPGRVTVVMNDGKRFTKETAYPRGDYRLPFSDDELAKKFRTLSRHVLTAAQQDRAIDLALNFRKGRVGDLMKSCTPGA